MSRWLVWMALVGACTKKNPDYCAGDSDCQDPTRPFCDVQGAYPESGNQANHCSVVPANCPLDRCGCTPGAAVSCQGDQLATCNADGQSTSASTCALGCATDARCLTFTPSNGLGPAFGEAAQEADVVLPANITIDTDLGIVRNSTGVSIPVKTAMVGQGSSQIRVLVAKSFVIDDAVVSGSAAVAFVASGRIAVVGKLDVGARGVQGGPGAQINAPCVGVDAQEALVGGIPTSVGPGGGGNDTSGGPGGGFHDTGASGGGAQAGVEPLVGGCRGGKVIDTTGAIRFNGGGGGGAVQLVSGTGISLSTRGVIDANGGGGGAPSGGGSGGFVIFEAPTVALSGAASGIATNGGSGGCSQGAGQDGTISVTPAHSTACAGGVDGDGGTGALAPRGGQVCTQTFCAMTYDAQGGGGAGGRTRIATRTGEYTTTDNPLLSTAVNKATLVAK